MGQIEVMETIEIKVQILGQNKANKIIKVISKKKSLEN